MKKISKNAIAYYIDTKNIKELKRQKPNQALCNMIRTHLSGARTELINQISYNLAKSLEIFTKIIQNIHIKIKEQSGSKGNRIIQNIG